MVHLFNDALNETYTELGNQIDEQVNRALSPIVDRAIEDDVSLRDLSYVLTGAVMDLILTRLIGRGINQRKKAKDGRERSGSVGDHE